MNKNGWMAALILCAASAAPRAGEIIILPPADGARGGATAATENRDRARAMREDGNHAAGTAIVVAPGPAEFDLFAPRGGENISTTRERARRYQRDEPGAQPTLLIVPQRAPAKPNTEREHLEANHNKARSYMKGETPAGVALSDGLPVVLCRDIDSVSGRIGDNNRSGSVISIIQNGKQVRVRCQ